MADDDLYLLLKHLLELTASSITDPPEIRFASLATPPMEQESISAWVESFFPSTNFPFPDTDPGTCATTLAVAVKVRLLRECWPVPRGSGRPVLPSPATVDEATSNRLREAIQVSRGLATAISSAPSAITPWPGYNAVLQRAAPVRPQAGIAGWDFPLTVQVRG